MAKINFAHIMPASYLPVLGLQSRCELVLAHVAKENCEYRDWFANNAPSTSYRGFEVKTKRIMDNGAFELGASMNPNELIELGHTVKATHLVLPDYPGEHYAKTTEAALEWGEKFRAEGFRTIFVPQGRVGNVEDFERCLHFGLRNRAWFPPATVQTLTNTFASSEPDAKPLVDQIAMSIIGVPNIFGAYKNKLQRFMARWFYLSSLPVRRPDLYDKLQDVPIHMLGLLDGVTEIEMIQQMLHSTRYNIESWDSSAAVWYAHNDIPIHDGSPTGRFDGKFELEVDFKAPLGSPEQIKNAAENMQFIDRACGH